MAFSHLSRARAKSNFPANTIVGLPGCTFRRPRKSMSQDSHALRDRRRYRDSAKRPRGNKISEQVTPSFAHPKACGKRSTLGRRRFHTIT
jgi:hypothetical protein